MLYHCSYTPGKPKLEEYNSTYWQELSAHCSRVKWVNNSSLCCYSNTNSEQCNNSSHKLISISHCIVHSTKGKLILYNVLLSHLCSLTVGAGIISSCFRSSNPSVNFLEAGLFLILSSLWYISSLLPTFICSSFSACFITSNAYKIEIWKITNAYIFIVQSRKNKPSQIRYISSPGTWLFCSHTYRGYELVEVGWKNNKIFQPPSL